jgi:hypothetical protein
MVEQQPSKLNTRVRFPSPAPSNFNGLARILDLIPTAVKGHFGNATQYLSKFADIFSPTDHDGTRWPSIGSGLGGGRSKPGTSSHGNDRAIILPSVLVTVSLPEFVG